MQTTAKELRFNTSAVFERLDMGEEITITYRGKVKAKLVPINESTKGKKITPNKLFGMWVDKADDVDGYVRSLRNGRSF
jgi:antitoxin (DNA-binding transcriptional repressor) of toxin-antitoxin stability system